MKIKMKSIKEKPHYFPDDRCFMAIWDYCVEYSYCKHPKETLRKLYISEKECFSNYWDKFVKANSIKSWCYYKDLIFEG